MKGKRFLRFLLIILFLFVSQGLILAAENSIPAPIGDIYVQDFANILTEQEKTELNQLGRKIEDQTTAQVAVLTIETIEDRSIEEFANEAFRQYRIGSQEKDNGVLLVMSMNERKLRIEVGYGLEGRIPDGKAGRILDEYTIPYLKNEQPNLAITETYKVLSNEVLAEYGFAEEELQQLAPPPTFEDEGLGIPSWLLIIIVIVVIFLDFKYFGGFLTNLLLSILSRGGRGGGGGGGGSRGGGGGSSGGGGASRGW